MTKRTIIATAVSIFAAGGLRHGRACRGHQVRRHQCLQGPERVQERQQRVQGPECLQGPGLVGGRERVRLHDEGRQGSVRSFDDSHGIGHLAEVSDYPGTLNNSAAQAIPFAFPKHRRTAWLGHIRGAQFHGQEVHHQHCRCTVRRGHDGHCGAGPVDQQVLRRERLQGPERLQQRRTSCKGKNDCKGKGMTVTGTTLECTARGGAPTP